MLLSWFPIALDRFCSRPRKSSSIMPTWESVLWVRRSIMLYQLNFDLCACCVITEFIVLSEMSHRSGEFAKIRNEAESDLRELLWVLMDILYVHSLFICSNWLPIVLTNLFYLNLAAMFLTTIRCCSYREGAPGSLQLFLLTWWKVRAFFFLFSWAFHKHYFGVKGVLMK